SLLSYQCDMALAGGVRVSIPQVTGYQYNEGFILSSDGHVRAFDAKASGTVPGEGVGLVMLKRLEDAIADRDNIHAIIKASAANNDGSLKAGYTAPSVEGEAEVIATAQAIAEVNPETISYIETHGTGTLVGDPIEITALTQAFRLKTNKKGFCAIGAVKCNIGHTDIASGIAGLIKTILSLKNKAIPPSINYDTPNPAIDFENSPFYVNTKLQDYKSSGNPRRAGVSAFGLGGTNVHVVLEEYQSDLITGTLQRPSHLVLLSGKSNSVLDRYSENLSTHLAANPKLNLADVAYSFKVGRQNFPHRRMLVAETLDEAAEALRNLNPEKVFTQISANEARSVVFMFAGGGAQYPGMASELYQGEVVFRKIVDKCLNILKEKHNLDVNHILYPAVNELEDARVEIEKPSIALPILFTVAYSLAKLLISWGIKPSAMIGHSMGEYVAACLSGTFSLEDALMLVVVRGRLFEKLPEGAMLSVPMGSGELKKIMGSKLSFAAINGPNLCVASGPVDEIEKLQKVLEQKEIDCRRLKISVAAHSGMLSPILGEFKQAFSNVRFNAPEIPFISNLSGTWISADEAIDPDYWVHHLSETVKFSDGLKELLKGSGRILLEVGPGRTLSTLVKQHPNKALDQPVFSSLRHPNEDISDYKFLLNVLGRLWLSGINIDWSLYYANEKRFRLSLPPYPFERKKYWIDSVKSSENRFTNEDQFTLKKQKDIGNWFYIPSWKRSLPPDAVKSKKDNKEKFVFFQDDFGIGDTLSKKIIGDISVVKKGTKFSYSNSGYTLNPNNPEHYQQLIDDLIKKDFSPTAFVHLWNLTNQKYEVADKNTITSSFYSLLYLAQAIGQAGLENEISVSVISDNLHEVETGDIVEPVKSLLLGPVRVIPLEFNNVRCQSIDINLQELDNNSNSDIINYLLSELTNPSNENIIAYRGNKRYIESFEQVLINPVSDSGNILHDNGVYIITGGLGGVGLAIAKKIAQTVKAKLVLLSRSSFLNEEEWNNWLKNNNNENETSLKIRQIKNLKSLGSEVMILSANVAEEDQIEEMIVKVKERFGQINGVVHSAGILNDGIIQLKTKEVVESVFSPKVKGTLLLNELLKDENLEFFVLCSALSTATGSLAQIDYVSANAFLNAFAHQNSAKNKVNTVAINWGTWKDVGLAAKTFAQ
ncbi:MAG: type I polyketide synthase, partial [Ignavibacteria bacterium]|nr:type I polyketide synthase [Ignavibacteria bacterium]